MTLCSLKYGQGMLALLLIWYLRTILITLKTLIFAGKRVDIMPCALTLLGSSPISDFSFTKQFLANYLLQLHFDTDSAPDQGNVKSLCEGNSECNIKTGTASTLSIRPWQARRIDWPVLAED